MGSAWWWCLNKAKFSQSQRLKKKARNNFSWNFVYLWNPKPSWKKIRQPSRFSQWVFSLGVCHYPPQLCCLPCWQGIVKSSVYTHMCAQTHTCLHHCQDYFCPCQCSALPLFTQTLVSITLLPPGDLRLKHSAATSNNTPGSPDVSGTSLTYTGD